MRYLRSSALLAAPLFLTLACFAADSASGEAEGADAGSTEAREVADALGTGVEDVGPDEVARLRYDRSWRTAADRDRAERESARGGESAAPGASTAAPGDTGAQSRSPADTANASGDATGESWDDIGSGSLDVDPTALPIEGEAEGPSVLAAQILLDRARFSPGVADGYWGKNTEKAVYWLQNERGLEPTGRLDGETLELLRREAGAPGSLSRTITLSRELASGPFVSIPEGIYERERLDCLCYESLGEKLAERFHTTRKVLGALNPGIDLDALSAGDALAVPSHGGPVDSLGARSPERRGKVARLVISDQGHYLHVLDESGAVLYHFPSTLGSEYAPSPSGGYAINEIARDPTWHYQPDLLTGEDPSREDAVIPAGPNNPVGVVWLDLTKPHYGIHGTAAPETIGYVTSHGCVRLTNWDAAFLADRAGLESGTPVQFRDTARSEGG